MLLLKRYFINDTFFQKNGPVFLIVTGEWETEPENVVIGAPVEYAKTFGALCIALEHRFYGKSWPTQYVLVIKNKFRNHILIFARKKKNAWEDAS